jgi:hypothetical protein
MSRNFLTGTTIFRRVTEFPVSAEILEISFEKKIPEALRVSLDCFFDQRNIRHILQNIYQ